MTVSLPAVMSHDATLQSSGLHAQLLSLAVVLQVTKPGRGGLGTRQAACLSKNTRIVYKSQMYSNYNAMATSWPAIQLIHWAFPIGGLKPKGFLSTFTHNCSSHCFLLISYTVKQISCTLGSVKTTHRVGFKGLSCTAN